MILRSIRRLRLLHCLPFIPEAEMPSPKTGADRLREDCKTARQTYPASVNLEEIKAAVASMSVHDRKELAAYLVTLRHMDLAGFRSAMTRKIDDQSPENWLTLEELDLRLEA